MGQRGLRRGREANALGAAVRQVRALELLVDGRNLTQVAEELGVGRPAALNLVRRALEERKAQLIDDVRALEASRLDAAANHIWPKVRAGDVRAQDTWLRNRQRYAALLGLDLKPPDVTVDQSQNVIVLPAWGEQPSSVDGEATETGLQSGITRQSDDRQSDSATDSGTGR